MNILVMHSKYLSGPASGENRVVADEVRLLSESGHRVRLFAPSPVRSASILRRLRLGVDAVWNHRALNSLHLFLDQFRPDVVHVHNLFPALSPAALRIVGDRPLVLTLHNYRLMCLPATFLRDGRPCEDCLGRVPWPGVVHRCYRGSLLGSSALAMSLSLHRRAGSFNRVHRFLAVSEFVRKKHVAAGFAPDRISVKPNFAWPTTRRRGVGSFFLFLGRLSPEKGVDLLTRVWRPTFGRLVIVGGGPEQSRLQARSTQNVEFRGQVRPSEVPELFARARALVLPSRSYEGSPRTIPEAYAAGVPVIASNIGALPELVEDGQTGRLVQPDDVTAWRDAIQQLSDNRESARMGEIAYEAWREFYTPERNVEMIEADYRAAMEALPPPHSQLQ